jgi:hypothetical protein
MSSVGVARGRRRQHFSPRGQPQERRQVARTQDPRRQGALVTQRAEARARAEKHAVLPEEDAAAFAALEAALRDELAPVGALQTLLARRIAVAAWRLERAERLEVELFEHRRYRNAGGGLALVRDGNGPRSFETLLR